MQLGQLLQPSFSDNITLHMEGNVAMVLINNEFASAKISTLGGSVLSFIPKNAENDSPAKDVLWVSPTANYDGNKPVRGGVPICWPWFGAHPTDASKPAHGFVRAMLWEIDSMLDLENGETEICLYCESDETTLEIWPTDFYLELRIVIGKTLTIALTTHNFADVPLEITEAFHTYFAVDNANKLVINGLDGAQHADKLTNAKVVTQAGVLTLTPPMDSVFLNQSGDIAIEDAGNNRTILLAAKEAQSSVVWNPGSEIVKGFADIEDDAWPTFVCVETGNVLENTLKIAPASKHTLTLTVSV